MKHIKITYEYIIETNDIDENVATDLIESKIYSLNTSDMITVISTRVVSNEVLSDDTLDDYTVSLDIDIQAKDTEDAIERVMDHIVNVDYTNDIQVVDVNYNGVVQEDQE